MIVLYDEQVYFRLLFTYKHTSIAFVARTNLLVGMFEFPCLLYVMCSIYVCMYVCWSLARCK